MPDRRSTLLGELDAAAFLRRHWQREPLLIRGALDGLEDALGADELAGLAGDPDVTSRIVLAQGQAAGQRLLRHGPFDAADFAALPDRGWTLLVQEVDRYVEPVAAILERVRFLPNWRIDDVMVSFAAPGGGVGAHVDRYDVFLVQASGRRRWSIESQPRPPEAPRDDTGSDELSLVAGFAPDRTWELDPGDVLYLPPGVAHDGVAIDGCMTWSIGFRAPAADELCAALLESGLEQLGRCRYRDPPLAPCGDDPGRITSDEFEAGRAVLREALDDDALWMRAMGRAATVPARGAAPPTEEQWTVETLRAALADGARLDRRALGELAWAATDDGRVLLFASGDTLELDERATGWVRLVTGCEPLDGPAVGPLLDDPESARLLTELLARGTLSVID